MKNLVRNSFILIILMVCAILAITPPETKLRLGKDLAGGVSLIYGVDVPPGETGVLNKVIDVVKERLDPQGVMEIGIVAQGNDRIEITMPLPTNDVKALKEKFEDQLKSLSASEISVEEFEVIAGKSAADRQAEVARVVAGDAKRLKTINEALASFDAVKPALAELSEAQRAVKQIEKLIADARTAGKPEDAPEIKDWTTARDAAKAAYAAAAEKAAPLQIKYENDRADALKGGVDPNELRRALVLSSKPIVIKGGGADNKLPPPRETAIDEIKRAHPDAVAKIDQVIADWNDYEAKRRTLDDPQDIVRILKGAGVLNFRIVVDYGTFAQEADARQQLQTLGPKGARTERVRWFKVNKIQNWVNSVQELKSIETPEGARAHFAARGDIVERYKGEYFMLCWDEPGFRLTGEDGNWQVAKAFEQPDQFGRPGIGFEMDASGSAKLGELTRTNVRKKMAVLLDDEVYTAPVLNSAISRTGIIEGNFNREELEYIIRVLSAGSLQARLSPEPISSTILAPTLGADNLKKGLDSGIVAFIVVGVFMIAYYFLYGVVAMIALGVNALLLVACMALNQAAFTLPGIAGVVLTFGQAIDANVLIYERIREELSRGHDLRTSMRLGYQRAMSAIVDGNITTLIVCVVLGFTGTQEIKGFGLTLGIGTVTTLFAQLFVTRLIFTFLIEKLRIRKLSMLTLVFPIINKWLVPKIDWMRLRFVSFAISFALAGTGLFFLATEGTNLLGLDFRGGTAVTINLKRDASGKPQMMTRAEVEAKLDKLKELSGGASGVEVVVVNPDRNDFARSDTFRIKTLVTKPSEVQAAVSEAFEGLIDSRPGLKFEGADAASSRTSPVYPLTDPILGDNFADATVREPVGDFIGGAAIVMRKLSPPTSVAEISDRLREFRNKPDYQGIQGRESRVVVLSGTPERATGIAILVSDPKMDYRENRDVWLTDVRDREWGLVQAALTQTSTLSSVESFSPSVASSFRNAAITAILLSTVMIIIYVWVRFNSFRYSAAAIVTTLHDCFCSVGFVAGAGVIARHFPETASMLGIMPFKIDLNLVAAILTTLGYSLNDTIIIMDRIRENRGKLPYASRKVINDSINQTISRTVITSGTTVIAVMVLYIYGGEGIRAFSFTMLCGVFIGTFSSIAVAAPLVWSRKADPRGDVPSFAPREVPVVSA